MKHILFATVLISAPTIASETEFLFGGEKDVSCSLNVSSDSQVPMLFGTDESLTTQHWASAEIVYDFAKKLKVISKQEWVDRSAWGNKMPEFNIFTDVSGDVSGSGIEQHPNSFYIGKSYVLSGGADKSVTYSMASQAESMTHQGKALLKAIVQFECE